MIHSWRRLAGTGLVLLALIVPLLAAGWRNDGTGRFPTAQPPLEWSKDKHVRWKVELPGKSLASPVIVGERVFVTSDPAELLCLSIEDGQTVWQKSHEYADVFEQEKAQLIEANLKLAEQVRQQQQERQRHREEARKAGDKAKEEEAAAHIEKLEQQYKELTVYPPHPGGDTGNSTSTPITDGERIFAVFATGIVSSHTLAGERKWMVYLAGARGDHSASPLLVDGKLIVHLRDLVALDPADGKELWRVKSEEQHGSPVAGRVGNEFLIVTASGDVIRARDGALLAKRQFKLGHNSPLVEKGVVYSLEDGAIKALQLPATADQEVEAGETQAGETKLAVLWESTNTRANQLASPVLHEGLLYGVGEKGILTVTDAQTGELVYRQRLKFDGGRVDASLCLAGEFLFVSSTNGTTLVLRPGREFEQVASNQLEGFSSSLAFAGERMFVRTSRTLFCVGK